jgi:hypothetical protein
MPQPKKKDKKEKKEKKAEKKPSSAGASKRSSTPSGKKGAAGKKKKKAVPEGPVEWKLTKDRLEELKSLNMLSSAIKTQITADMEHLNKAFPARKPFKHWTLKSSEV